MKTNNFNYKTTEQQDDYIQSMSIDELKTSFVGKPIFTENENIGMIDEYDDIDEKIQNLQINELENFVNSAKQLEQNNTLQYKIKHTGLDKNSIQLIENNKHRATLEQLISYCKGLKISYKEFLPELY